MQVPDWILQATCFQVPPIQLNGHFWNSCAAGFKRSQMCQLYKQFREKV